MTAITPGLIPLIRWFHANGWTHTRKPAPRRCGDTHTWRRDDTLVMLACSWADVLDSNGQPLPPLVLVWERVDPEDVDDDNDIVRVDAISVERVARVLTAVGVLPANWRGPRTSRVHDRQLAGQLTVMDALIGASA